MNKMPLNNSDAKILFSRLTGLHKQCVLEVGWETISEQRVDATKEFTGGVEAIVFSKTSG